IGTTYGSHGTGVALHGGSVTNAAGGTIGGYTGISVTGDTGFVSNEGTIVSEAYGVGVRLDAADNTLVNTGAIYGYNYGIVATGKYATIENAGTISGIYEAIRFTGYQNRLIIDPGAVFEGSVYGSLYDPGNNPDYRAK